jgi:hypothetical protein
MTTPLGTVIIVPGTAEEHLDHFGRDHRPIQALLGGGQGTGQELYCVIEAWQVLSVHLVNPGALEDVTAAGGD